MRSSFFFFGATTTFFCLAGLCSLASSQIVGCDSLECRQTSSDDDSSSCPLSEDGVGATAFQSNITNDGPLTWSLVGSEDDATTQQAPKNAKRIIKSLYLGTPPSLLLQDADFHGCSLMFFNITSALQTVPGYSDFPHFGCDTVLGSQCAADLLEQGRQELDKQLNSIDEASICDPIRQAIQDSLPDSCRLPFGRTSWGNINGQGFAGFDRVSYISEPQGKCDITGQGSQYNIVRTNYFSNELDPDSEEAALWRNGTTPMMTLFFNRAGDSNPGLVDGPEAHLTCLRTVSSKEEAANDARRSIAGISWIALLATTLVAAIM